MIDESSLLLVLQSLTGSFLLRRSPAQVIPMAGMGADVFAITPWNELGLSAEEAAALTARLGRMFPGPELCAAKSVATLLPLDSARIVHSAWRQGEGLIVYESSGSSGQPKLLTQRAEAVVQEVETVAGLFSGVSEVIAATPQYHCYGFTFGTLLPKRLQAGRRSLPPLPTIISHALAENTLIVGYPDLWSRLKPERTFCGKGAVCLSAGSPWPEDDMKRLQACGLELLEIYGSSENGAVGYRRGPDDFTLVDYWKRASLPDGSEVLERTLPSGEVLRCPPQDSLQWTGEETFRPLKRLDNAVQVSGMNVYPAQVARFIESHPKVRECRVRLMRPEEGRRLKAFAVPQPDAELRNLVKELRLYCKNGLSTPERPVAFRLGESLPRNEFGKDADWDI